MRYTQDIREIFENRPDQDISLKYILSMHRGLSTKQVQNAMSRLRYLDVRYVTVVRGKVWKLSTDGKSRSFPRPVLKPREAFGMTSKSNIPEGDVLPVPDSEPLAEFRVLGTTVETGELLLTGASAGVEGVWLARRVS